GYNDARATATVEAGASVYIELELAENTAQLAEVVVRSEKFIRNLQETQTSVGVVSDEVIRAIPIRDWEDATLLLGNVSTTGGGTFNIRGIPNTGLGGGGAPTAALYVDGVQQGVFTTSRTIRGAWDLESVEVFRGPQSTLSGRNALAGAVYLRSAAPSFDWGAAARVRGGSQEALEGAFMVTGPLIKDQLAFRVSGEAGSDDREIDYVNLDTSVDGFGRTNTRVMRNIKSRLLWTPKAVPSLSVLANYTYAFDRPIGFQGVSGVVENDGSFDYSERQSLAPNAIFDETTLHNSSLEITYGLGSSLTLTALTGAVFSDYSIDGLTYQTTNPSIIVPISQRSMTDEFTITQELRLNYETDRTQAVFGGYYGRFAYDRSRNDFGDAYYLAQPQLVDNDLILSILQGQPLPVFGIIFDSLGGDDSDSQNIAVFGEVNHEVADGLTVTAGLRYDNETLDRSTFNDSIGANFEGVAGTPFSNPLLEAQIVGLLLATINTEDQEIDTEYEALLPKIGLTYDLTKDASIGATVQRGYRAGGAQTLTIGEVNQFDPEFTWNYELALRSRWLDGRLVANANVFYTDWTDQQISVPIPENIAFFRTENAGASTLYGGELEIRAIPTKGLSLFTSLGLSVSEFDEFVSDGRDLAGFEFPGAPAGTFAVGGIYDAGNGPFLAASLSYVGEHYSQVGSIDTNGRLSNDPVLRSGDYTIVDAQIGYAFDVQGTDVKVTGFARNLFDTVARETVAFDTFGLPSATLRMPRVIGLSLDVEL
ncbi:MAG: TonB-dependent receptor, partial [Bacteroidota bacterium]